MIRREEIRSVANEAGLEPKVVEKDYVLGWLLAGIFGNPKLRAEWIFKGGTCLKKCYFETYRFSEDLDFTLKNEAHINEEFLKECFSEISERLYEEAGIEIPPEQFRFDIRPNPRDKLICEGRIHYKSHFLPEQQRTSWPRIKLDLSADEIILNEPIEQQVMHAYSDQPDSGIFIQSYTYEEVFGEKFRALIDRKRPRDLYDVVNMYRHTKYRPPASAIREILQKKCEFKDISFPNIKIFEAARESLEQSWHDMLSHQLRELPPFELYWDELPEIFLWLESKYEPVRLASHPHSERGEIYRPAIGGLRLGSSADRFMETVRFAAANRLCVDLHYNGNERPIEPYSLRRTKDDNILLMGIKADTGEIRSYRVDRIQGARVTHRGFKPKYEVEFNPSGPLHAPETSRVENSGTSILGTQRRSSPTGRRSSTTSRMQTGPTYIFECMYYGKKFRRKSHNSRLNSHKDKNGYSCPGRTGVYVETKY